MSTTKSRSWILLAALGLGLSPTPAAGVGERLLLAPVFDHASETTHRQVTWDDFKGKKPKTRKHHRWGHSDSPNISVEVRIGRYKVKISRQGEGWLARPEKAVRPYAVMHKTSSSMPHGSRNAATLGHEQLHFDLAEATARRMTVALIPFEGRGATGQEAGEDLAQQIRKHYDSDIEELLELQAFYDHETELGKHKKKQKQWAQKVAEIFRQASAELAAAIEAGLDQVGAER